MRTAARATNEGRGIRIAIVECESLLKLSLKRGALVTAANWQVVLVQFVADTLFKTLLAVPIIGGLMLVALVVGGNPFDLLHLDDLTKTVSTMMGVLLAQPLALAAFAPLGDLTQLQR